MPEENKKPEELEEELVPVGDGIEEPKPPKEPEEKLKTKKVEEEEDDDLDDDDDDDDDDDEEEGRLGAGEDDDEDEKEKRRRRRQERKSRRQRQKEARDRDKRELAFLERRNEELERRFSQLESRVGYSETSQLDARINKLKSDLKLADNVIEKAISSSDGAAYREAQQIRDNLRDNLYRFEAAKEQIEARGQAPQVDNRVISHAQQWWQAHSWWDPSGGDPDSAKVKEIDAQLVQERFDPTSAEYWNELSKRVERELPHRSPSFRSELDDDDEEDPQPPKGKRNGQGKRGPAFSTGGRERPLKKGEVYISPERRRAMEEAGVWDDPELRQKYLRSYAKYDAEASGNT